MASPHICPPRPRPGDFSDTLRGRKLKILNSARDLHTQPLCSTAQRFTDTSEGSSKEGRGKTRENQEAMWGVPPSAMKGGPCRWAPVPPCPQPPTPGQLQKSPLGFRGPLRSWSGLTQALRTWEAPGCLSAHSLPLAVPCWAVTEGDHRAVCMQCLPIQPCVFMTLQQKPCSCVALPRVTDTAAASCHLCPLLS